MKKTLIQVGTYLGVTLYMARSKDFGKLSVRASVNLLEPSLHESDAALERAINDGFECIINYELTDKQFNELAPMHSGVI